MFAKVWHKLTAAKSVQFCDECAQVCSSACRAGALYSRVREQAATYQMPYVR